MLALALACPCACLSTQPGSLDLRFAFGLGFVLKWRFAGLSLTKPSENPHGSWGRKSESESELPFFLPHCCALARPVLTPQSPVVPIWLWHANSYALPPCRLGLGLGLGLAYCYCSIYPWGGAGTCGGRFSFIFISPLSLFSGSNPPWGDI